MLLEEGERGLGGRGRRGGAPGLGLEPAQDLPRPLDSGTYRANLAKAIELLGQAGWSIRDGLMTNEETGEPLSIEFLLQQPSFERVVQPYLRDLA